MMNTNNDDSSESLETPPCRFFFLQNSCRFGDQCAFSHVTPSGMTRVDVLKQIPCPFYARGNCRYGEHCQLKHEESMPSGTNGSNDSSGDGKKGKSTNAAVDDNTNDDDDICGICLERVKETSNGNKYGLSDCCPQVFCYKCLMAWRTEGSREAKDRRACPACRKHSNYVIPSLIKPRNEEHKRRIVNDYKYRLGRTPCKLFDGTLGSCRYGSDCLYAHKNENNGEDMKSRDRTMQQLWTERQQEQQQYHYGRSRANNNRRGAEDSFDLGYLDAFMMMLLRERILVPLGSDDDSDDRSESSSNDDEDSVAFGLSLLRDNLF